MSLLHAYYSFSVWYHDLVLAVQMAIEASISNSLVTFKNGP